MQQKEMLSCTAITLLIDNGKQRETLLQVVEQLTSTTFIPSNSVNDKIAIVVGMMDNHEKLWHSTTE